MMKQWYALHVRSKHEKKVAKLCELKSIIHYVPLYERLSQWVDRKKVIYEPLFKGYLFVQIDPQEVLPVLNVQGVVGIVGRSAHDYVPVPEDQINSIRIITSQKNKFDPYPYLQEGRMVRVVRGPLKGVCGRLVRKDNMQRLVISVDLIQQAISAKVDAAMVETL